MFVVAEVFVIALAEVFPEATRSFETITNVGADFSGGDVFAETSPNANINHTPATHAQRLMALIEFFTAEFPMPTSD